MYIYMYIMHVHHSASVEGNLRTLVKFCKATVVARLPIRLIISCVEFEAEQRRKEKGERSGYKILLDYYTLHLHCNLRGYSFVCGVYSWKLGDSN